MTAERVPARDDGESGLDVVAGGHALGGHASSRPRRAVAACSTS